MTDQCKHGVSGYCDECASEAERRSWVSAMTDPKLVERAKELINITMNNGYKNRVDSVAQALQAHGDEVRKKTLEECFSVSENTFTRECPLKMREAISKNIRKLLEVKGA